MPQKPPLTPLAPPGLQSCVSPEGLFVYGLHHMAFHVANMRASDRLESLGALGEGGHRLAVTNAVNLPPGDVAVSRPQDVYEIANPLPFRGTTYIGKQWADRTAEDPARIAIETPPRASMTESLAKSLGDDRDKEALVRDILCGLPQTIKLALATTANDPEDLIALAEFCCTLIHDADSGRPTGMAFESDPSGANRPKISDPHLFELVANNPRLPDDYKRAMVLRPGIQGASEIVGEWQSSGTHVYEYLRSNSYIAGGHYAANMADDAVRYDVGSLTLGDMSGLRGLYYQRTYIRMAEALGIGFATRHRTLSASALEALRCKVMDKIDGKPALPFSATLWGWNYGFDAAPSGYRLHASHQQIHQQYALIPDTVPSAESGSETSLRAYACGDLVQEWVARFRQAHGKGFFDCYAQAIVGNQRMDGNRQGPRELVVFDDDQVMLFVPKAQTSQWELQLMPSNGVGNILEADEKMRRSLDKAMLLAMQTLRKMGAQMITVLEYSKRFHIADDDQRLLYVFLPRLPESPGAFSEAQLRWINGHYPEDFAQACRLRMDKTVS